MHIWQEMKEKAAKQGWNSAKRGYTGWVVYVEDAPKVLGLLTKPTEQQTTDSASTFDTSMGLIQA